jgi:hypothetical protein
MYHHYSALILQSMHAPRHCFALQPPPPPTNTTITTTTTTTTAARQRRRDHAGAGDTYGHT